MPIIGIQEMVLFTVAVLIRFGIPLAFVIWIIVAIKRIAAGIHRLSSRLDVIEQILHEKGDLEKV